MPRLSGFRFLLRAAVLTLAALVAGTFAAITAFADDEETWALMKKPGHFVLLRHSYSPETPDDAAVVDFKNCATQRNLDDVGRAQARRIGDAFRKHGIAKANLVASQYCRAMETAKLTGLGPVRALPGLNMLAGFGKRGDAKRQIEAYLKSLPKTPLTILVTHVGNIQAVAGTMVSSGEMIVVRLMRPVKLSQAVVSRSNDGP